MLMNAGFSEHEALEALKQSNNDIETALLAITFNRSARNQQVDDTVHQLQSMGYDPTRAREAATAADGDLTAALEFLSAADHDHDDQPAMEQEQCEQEGHATHDEVDEGEEDEGGEEDENSDDMEEQEEKGRDESGSSSDHEANELLLDGYEEDDEAHLDTTLQEEGHAIKMFLSIVQGQIPANLL